MKKKKKTKEHNTSMVRGDPAGDIDFIPACPLLTIPSPGEQIPTNSPHRNTPPVQPPSILSCRSDSIFCGWHRSLTVRKSWVRSPDWAVCVEFSSHSPDPCSQVKSDQVISMNRPPRFPKHFPWMNFDSLLLLICTINCRKWYLLTQHESRLFCVV